MTLWVMNHNGTRALALSTTKEKNKMSKDYFAEYRNQYTIKHRAFTQTLPRYSAKCWCGEYDSNADEMNDLIEMMSAHKHTFLQETHIISNACECGGDGVRLDDVMAGETECEGCETWVCKECGQDV